MSLSKKVKNTDKEAVSWIGNFEQTAAELAIQQKYDYVICGHIHQPQKRTITTKDGSVTYLNSGDWVENLTALELQNNEWTIYQYNANQFTNKEQQFEKRLPKLEVVTNEVFLQLNTLTLPNVAAFSNLINPL
jgi:predicted phosphodiesterase